MQFKVPQFLDIEDKIFGPFTFSEFVYLAGGAGLCFVLFKTLGLLLGLIPILMVAGLSLALTFYKPNNKPLVDMLESGVKYIIQDKLYIWKKQKKEIIKVKERSKINQAEADKLKETHIRMHSLSGSKLRDLAWSLDMLDLKK